MKKLQHQFFSKGKKLKEVAMKKKNSLDFYSLWSFIQCSSLLVMSTASHCSSGEAAKWKLLSLSLCALRSAVGLSQQLVVLQPSSQRTSHVSRCVLHVLRCSDGSVQRAVQTRLLSGGQGASQPPPHFLVASDPWWSASAVARRHVEGQWVQPEERAKLTKPRISGSCVLYSKWSLQYNTN